MGAHADRSGKSGRRFASFAALAAALLALSCLLPCLAPAPALAGEGEPASSTDYGSRMEIDDDRLVAVTADMIEDGTYSIAVRTDSSLFRVMNCELTVADGHLSVMMQLHGHGYRFIYQGVGEDAYREESNDAYSHYTVDEETGRYCYEIEIPSLNAAVDVTALSSRKNLWYDHQLIFLASSLPTSALTSEGQAAVRESSTVKDLPNGVYTCTAQLTGGSGRASLTDPCQVTLVDGIGVARIEWSSQYYDYMIVGSTPYYPVNDGGNSVFEIPIAGFDVPLTVIADTTALSQPYEIEYQITFYSSSLQQKSSVNGPGWPIAVIVAGAFCVAYLVVSYAARRAHRTARERRK